MSDVPADLKYTRSHEWVRVADDGTLTLGITEHAQDQLGDMVFVEVPEAGRRVQASESCAVVESVKAASDIYSPVAGEVLEANTALADTPELVNKEPYGDGWLLRLRADDPAALEALLDADGYRELLAAEE